jgi:hypothetical protein
MTLTEPSVLHLSADQVTLPLCNGSANGTIKVNPTGGTGPYSYQWSDSQTGAFRSALTGGTYSVVVSDAKNCQVSKSYVLLSPQQLQLINVQVSDPKCAGEVNGSVSVSVIGGVSPYTFAWTPGSSSASQINNLGAGTYSLQVKDANGCSHNASYTLVEPARPVIAGIAAENIICTGGKATLTPEGNWLSYDWRGPQGFVSASSTISTGVGGNYTLTALDLRQCPATLNFKVTVSASAMVADFLRLSEAIAYEPIVFVDISTPLPQEMQWHIPEDDDVLINSENGGMIELVFRRTGSFEIGLTARTGNCSSTLYKVVTIEEATAGGDGDNSSGREGEKEKISITVYPNPMMDDLSILLSAPGREVVTLRMVSAGDSKVVAQRTVEGQLDYLVNWNLPELKAGIYQLLCEYNNTVYSTRIVVIR